MKPSHAARNGDVIVACGSLSRELGQVLREDQLACDLRFLDATLCLRPRELHDALERKLRDMSQAYRRIYLIYGGCAPDIDWLADVYGACRPPVAHCYELLAGARFRELLQEELGTYFLSPSLCRDFQRRVVDGLGLGNFQQAKEIIFSRYRRTVYLRTHCDPSLDEKARQVAAYLGFPLQVEDVGLTSIKQQLLPLLLSGDEGRAGVAG